MSLDQAIEGVGKILEHPLHHRAVNRFLRFEVVVEGTEAHVGGLGDLVDRDPFHALLRHQTQRRFEQALPGLAFAPRPARFALGRGDRSGLLAFVGGRLPLEEGVGMSVPAVQEA